MGTLEKITNMKNQRMQDSEIINQLQAQGVSPKEINDALSQYQVKNAVSNEPQGSGEMQQENTSTQEQYQPTQEYDAPQQQEQNYSQGYEQQDYSQNYEQQGYGGYPQDSNSSIDIAEQVFDEKIQKTQKKVEENSQFKNLAENKIKDMDQRLKRIEKIIDKLQISILDKVSSYTESIDGIKKEMSMMQDSFGKVVNQAVKKKTSKKKK